MKINTKLESYTESCGLKIFMNLSILTKGETILKPRAYCEEKGIMEGFSSALLIGH